MELAPTTLGTPPKPIASSPSTPSSPLLFEPTPTVRPHRPTLRQKPASSPRAAHRRAGEDDVVPLTPSAVPSPGAANRLSFGAVQTSPAETLGLGPLAQLALPSSAYVLDLTGNADFAVRPAAGAAPLVAFVNPKSGSNQGVKLMAELRKILNPRQVFDLLEPKPGGGVYGPSKGLLIYKDCPGLRLLVCGGDGTVGWVLDVIDKLGLDGLQIPVAFLPLGTGNDMARALKCGAGYRPNLIRLPSPAVFAPYTPLAEHVHSCARSRAARQIPTFIDSFVTLSNNGLESCRYTGEPMSKYLHKLVDGRFQPTKLDRWAASSQPIGTSGGAVRPVLELGLPVTDELPQGVFNNYLSLGAHTVAPLCHRLAPGRCRSLGLPTPKRASTYARCPVPPLPSIVPIGLIIGNLTWGDWAGPTGLDALIALRFHVARETNPAKFKSRLKNKMRYGLMGAKAILTRPTRDMSQFLELQCDGADLTGLVRRKKIHALLFVNIGSWGAGANPWGTKKAKEEFAAPQYNDGLIEVIGMTRWSMIKTQGKFGHAIRIKQCRAATVRIHKPMALQMDGEPVMLGGATEITIDRKNQATMLYNAQTGGCCK